MGSITMIGKTFRLSAFRGNATRKKEYWDADPLHTHTCLCLHTNPRCTKEQLPSLHKRDEHGQKHLRAQTSDRRGGCPTDRGCGNTPHCGEVSESSASACLKIQGGDVRSIMFTFSESDKMISIPESTVPYKQLTLENSPYKTRESCPLQPTTFCNACNASSVKYLIQMSKKKKTIETAWV